MELKPLVEHGQVVESLRRALRNGEHGLDVVPGLIKRVLREDAWRERIVEATSERVTFATFEQFVTKHPPEGLGATIRTIQNVCRDDVEACDLIDQAVKNPHGGDRLSNVDNINVANRPTGTSRDAALRRLRKDRPDLHKRVLAGELSPHAAMIQGGFRKVPTPLELLLRAWTKASEKERAEFLDCVAETMTA